MRCGYVTLDEARRAVFLLDDDPLVEATPLVGVFCAGFVCADARRACRDGAVVAACAAFLRRSGTALVEAETCLVAVFCAPARNQPAKPAFLSAAAPRTAAARSWISPATWTWPVWAQLVRRRGPWSSRR